MLNEIDVDGLRACLQFGGFPGCNLCNGEGCFNVDYGDGRDVCPYCKERRDAALPALLDEFERLRKVDEVRNLRAFAMGVAEEAYRRRAESAEAERDALAAENARIRAALAHSDQPCAYCSLPKEDWGKCARGFPGCARGDDAMGCPELGAALERDALKERLERVREEPVISQWTDTSTMDFNGAPMRVTKTRTVYEYRDAILAILDRKEGEA